MKEDKFNNKVGSARARSNGLRMRDRVRRGEHPAKLGIRLWDEWEDNPAKLPRKVKEER